jgi:hypothetical protein
VSSAGLALALVTSIVLGCAGKQQEREKPAAETTAGQDSSLRGSIVAQVAKAPCSSASVCRTIGLGVKPCGGPQEYLIYSTAATDSARLTREVARYNEAEAKRNREQGLVSDCRALLRPRVSCVSGQCAATAVGAR